MKRTKPENPNQLPLDLCFPGTIHPREYKAVALRECPTPIDQQVCEEPGIAAAYWHRHIATQSQFNPEVEFLFALLLNTRRRIKGHSLIASGTLDTTIFSPRELFRVAVIGCASAIIMMHNHPSGDPEPSPADIEHTGRMIQAGEILGIEVLDHVVIGSGRYCSLRTVRECGFRV
jgi:DNA repair protein RadC